MECAEPRTAMVGAGMVLGRSAWCAASLLSGRYSKTFLNGLYCAPKVTDEQCI